MMRKPVMSLQNHDQLPSRPREWIEVRDGGFTVAGSARFFIQMLALPCDGCLHRQSAL
jgi:hypothetical protein